MGRCHLEMFQVYGALFCVQCIFSFNSICAKVVLSVLHPYIYMFLRTLGGVVVMYIMTVSSLLTEENKSASEVEKDKPPTQLHSATPTVSKRNRVLYQLLSYKDKSLENNVEMEPKAKDEAAKVESEPMMELEPRQSTLNKEVDTSDNKVIERDPPKVPPKKNVFLFFLIDDWKSVLVLWALGNVGLTCICLRQISASNA
ncbi:hypothetical protein RFI_10204 [Reticulomyxa filosa]|uniref:Uncharacterized protein n=1 Tax=Reticulomyxa filosa TaxID=46433 RepID=X6NNJ0_RETFI|nr:hypothetical protein RFI_10204 [Reticulomyxa filosa]|eukprot:ETO26932.1 hypothetical protein RFI_10204 [Reticulomyxa filosa]